MLDATAIKTAFSGLVGWRQNANPNGVQLTANNLASSSGLRYERHPYLTVDNVEAVAPDFIRLTSDPAQRASQFNYWLKAETDEVLLEAITAWWSAKFAADSARPLLANRESYWYDTYSTFDGVATGKRLGVRVTPKKVMRGMGKIVITHMGLRFGGPYTFTLYDQIHGSTERNSQELDYTGNGEEQFIKLINPIVVTGGSAGHYLYYDTEEATPLVMVSRGNCNCRMSSELLTVNGIETQTGAGRMFPPVTSNNWGLNPRLRVECGYEDFLADNAGLFADYVSLYVADHFLRIIAANPNARLNRHEGMQDPDRILYEVDGDPRGRRTGLGKKLAIAMDAVKLDTTALHDKCLPCNATNRITRLKTG